MVDNKVLPVMREALVSVQMILFKVLRQSLQECSPDQPEKDTTLLAGAVINSLFATQPVDKAAAAFAASNRELVEQELRQLAERCLSLRPLLTDALRMKTICDNQEGIHSIASLIMAKELGLLVEDQPLPLPSTFMMEVRSLAVSHGLIKPM